MSDFYDELQKAAESGFGGWAKFEAIGDTIVGTVIKLRRGEEQEGKRPFYVDLDVGDEKPTTLDLNKFDLIRKWNDVQPQVGQKVRVRYVGLAGRMKLFTVDVSQSTPPPRPAPTPVEDTPPIDEYGEEPF